LLQDLFSHADLGEDESEAEDERDLTLGGEDYVTRDTGSDEDEEGAEVQYMYDDFWGPSQSKKSSRSRKQG